MSSFLHCLIISCLAYVELILQINELPLKPTLLPRGRGKQSRDLGAKSKTGLEEICVLQEI